MSDDCETILGRLPDGSLCRLEPVSPRESAADLLLDCVCFLERGAAGNVGSIDDLLRRVDAHFDEAMRGLEFE